MRLPQELVDHIVDELDDAALWVVGQVPPERNPWFYAAAQTARKRYARGARTVYAHRAVCSSRDTQHAMWPQLYAEQCGMRASLGAEAPRPDDTTLSCGVGLELTMLLPLFAAHKLSAEPLGAHSLIGTWLGALDDRVSPPRAAIGQSQRALLLLSLMPNALRASRFFHMQAAGALMRTQQSDAACAAYAMALVADSGAQLPLGLYEAQAVSRIDVVQHMLSSAVVCNDHKVWLAALAVPEVWRCLAQSEAHLLAVVARLGHTQMHALILQARLARAEMFLVAR